MAGRIPPPHTIIMKMPEAAAVYLPRPSTARLKMPPHITEVHRPQSTKNMMLIGTSTTPNEMSLLNTGIETVVLIGARMAISTNASPNDATVASIFLLDTLAATEAPARRPTSIRNQYVPTIVPASAVAMPSSLVMNKFAMLGIPTSTPT